MHDNYGNFEVRNGPQNKKCTNQINIKRTNKIQDDDAIPKDKYF